MQQIVQITSLYLNIKNHQVSKSVHNFDSIRPRANFACRKHDVMISSSAICGLPFHDRRQKCIIWYQILTRYRKIRHRWIFLLFKPFFNRVTIVSVPIRRHTRLRHDLLHSEKNHIFKIVRKISFKHS